jgi:hypothetical protein
MSGNGGDPNSIIVEERTYVSAVLLPLRSDLIIEYLRFLDNSIFQSHLFFITVFVSSRRPTGA